MSPTSIKATLLVIHAADRPLQDRSYPLESEVSIGRGEENTIVLTSDQASRRHATIRPDAAGGHQLEDLGSTNGTFVNSRPVKERRLVHGDVVRVASTVMKYVVG
jgi:pSer/pThr/pTyr-binding forkhead associated (FHA) protein